MKSSDAAETNGDEPGTSALEMVPDLSSLAGVAIALGAAKVPGWSRHEDKLAAEASVVPRSVIAWFSEQILQGADPLGRAFCVLRSAPDRRPLGQTYTPNSIVESMIDWLAQQFTPVRVIDPGVGSARFLVKAGQKWPDATLVGVDVDPLAALMARANLAVLGFADRSEVLLEDFRAITLPPVSGPTAFVGNPPYVRHHQIEKHWKQWLTDTARRRGLSASQLAGLHVHFFLATVEASKPGDGGTFITSSEWLDVNYGRLVRQLALDGLGATAVHVVEPEAMPFADAATTAAITCFDLHTAPSAVRMRRVEKIHELGSLQGGEPIARRRLEETDRWSGLTNAARKLPTGYSELGELCRVRRGTATGANSVWVTARNQSEVPERFLLGAVTKAKELFDTDGVLSSDRHLKCIIDLPQDLDTLADDERVIVERFIAKAREKKVDKGYLASARKVWYSVGVGKPAPILATYMARQPPTFVLNKVSARHLNIAHGLHPLENLSQLVQERLADFLRAAVRESGERRTGRTYAGGLTKFEPREMERLIVPELDILLADDWDTAKALEPLRA